MAALCLNLGGGRWVGEWWVAIAIVGGTPPFYGYALFALALPLLPICISHTFKSFMEVESQNYMIAC